MDKLERCTATTRDGRPCPGRPLPGKDVCFAHDPDLNSRPRRQTAGRQKANRIRAQKRLGIGTDPLDLRDVDAMLGTALAGVLAGEVEPGVAAAAATVARAIVATRQASDLEGRISELERRAERREGAA